MTKRIACNRLGDTVDIQPKDEQILAGFECESMAPRAVVSQNRKLPPPKRGIGRLCASGVEFAHI